MSIDFEIGLVSGRMFKFSDISTYPTIEEMAHSLSQLARFNGHLVDFFSVAKHSLMVADICGTIYDDPQLALIALLHDAGESVIGDIPSPVKKLINMNSDGFLKDLEDKILARILEEHVGVCELPDLIHEIDIMARHIEAEQRSKCVSWVNVGQFGLPEYHLMRWRKMANEYENPSSLSTGVGKEFIDTYRELKSII